MVKEVFASVEMAYSYLKTYTSKLLSTDRFHHERITDYKQKHTNNNFLKVEDSF